MRKIDLSLSAISTLVGLVGTLACAGACSSSVTSTSSGSPEPSAASPSAGGASGSSTGSRPLSLSLTGDGHALHVNGAPADPSYSATYPITGLTAMNVTASPVGDLAASCASGGGTVACKSLPFFSTVSGGSVKVYDAYAHVVMTVPLPPGLDAGGALPPLPIGALAAGAGAALGFDAGSCAPTVNASLASCSLTIGGTTCDCCDPTCASSAIEGCLGSLGVPVGAGSGSPVGSGSGGFPFGDGGVPGLGSIGSLDDAGIPGLGSIGSLDDAGIPGLGSLDDAGALGTACSASTLASAKAQFCADVDAWVLAHGGSATLDCAALGTLSFPTTLPPASSSSFTCDQATHDAFVKVRAGLATCDPLEYIGWDSSAELQLFEDSACTVW